MKSDEPHQWQIRAHFPGMAFWPQDSSIHIEPRFGVLIPVAALPLRGRASEAEISHSGPCFLDSFFLTLRLS
jgi:hypothetical protein